ncbi:MAG: lipoprotein insertase outer membrane protein LolB [Sodalis sp. (in: enterobacteria)]
MPKCKHAVFRFMALISLLLTACSIHSPFSLAKNQTSSEWRIHQKSVCRLTHYKTTGAVVYLSSQQKVYARFNWHEISVNRYRLILTNPIGSPEIDLNVKDGVAELINNQGKHYFSDDPQILIQKLCGISIPLKDLRKWILGLPGDATDFTLDSRGYLRTLHYSYNGQSWIVTYKYYEEDTMPALPSHLELRHGENYIKLKIDSWNL